MRGTNREELLAIRVLVVALVQAFLDLVQALVDLVQALFDLVQALVALVQAHVDLGQARVALVQTYPPQVGLIWLVSRLVVMGPRSGLVGAF